MILSIKNGGYAFLIRLGLMFSMSLWQEFQLSQMFYELQNPSFKKCCNFYPNNFKFCVFNNTSYIFTIFTTACGRISSIIIFTHSRCFFFFIFTLTLTFIVTPVLIRVTFSTIKITFRSAWYMFCFLFFHSFIPVIKLTRCRFKSSLLIDAHTLL